MCMWSYDGENNNSDRIIAFYTYSFWEAFYSKGNGVCVINSLLWIFLKPCIHFVHVEF